MKHLTGIAFDNLYPNCVYSMSIHIASCVRLPYIQNEKSWENNFYSIQEYGGTEGTMYFDGKHHIVVGAFRNLRSTRMALYPGFEALSLFDAANAESRAIAKDGVLAYLLTSVRKKTILGHKMVNIPLATTCLWNEYDDIYSCDAGSNFAANGGNYVCDVSDVFDSVKTMLIEYYESTPVELECAMMLFGAKMSDSPQVSKRVIERISPLYKGCSEFWEAVELFGITVIE